MQCTDVSSKWKSRVVVDKLDRNIKDKDTVSKNKLERYKGGKKKTLKKIET